MDIEITSQHLEILLGNPETPEFQQSWSIIEEFRKVNLATFLIQMIQIFTNPALNPSLRHLAIILSYQVFPSSVEGLKENPFLALNLPKEVISQILLSSSNTFADEFLHVRMGAATLFSRIACIDVLTNDQFDITKTLITGFTSPSSPQAFESICMVLIDLFMVSTMDDEELNVILSSLFGYLSSSEESVNNIMRKYCLKILSTIINNMGDVLTDTQNVNSLFTALFAMSSNPETKAEAFDCWSEFTVNYYPMLAIIAPQIAESSFIELASETNDRETIINVCVFWKSIAECEISKKAELHIINQVINVLLPLLFNISVKIPFDQCDNPEDYEPHIAAASAMQSVVAAAPIESMPILLKFVNDFSSVEGNENFSFRECALNCLNFIIQFCDCSPILIDSLTLIFNGLNDTSPRVKQTAVYCVHAILNSILTNVESCPFASLVPQIGLKIVHLSSLVMNLLIGNVDVNVASTAASATAEFIQFPGFPYAGKALTLLLETAVRASMPDSLLLSQSAFSALQASASKCPSNLLVPLMAAVLQILKQSVDGECDFWFVNHLCHLLQVIYVRMPAYGLLLNEETVNFSWSLFETIFGRYSNEATILLSPLSALARAAGQLFVPFLPAAAEFILLGLQNYEREESIPSASLGVSLLSDCFDLSPFSLRFFEEMTKAVAEPSLPLQSKRFVVDAVGDLAFKCPQVFAQVAQNVMLPIVSICENVIANIIAYSEDELFDSEFDMDDILCSFLRCLQKVTVALVEMNPELALKIAEALNDLLESVGGMKEHGDKLLQTAVEAMLHLIQLFPELMKENLKDEPGFVVILQEAQGAEIMLQAVQLIFNFMEMAQQ